MKTVSICVNMIFNNILKRLETINMFEHSFNSSLLGFYKFGNNCVRIGKQKHFEKDVGQFYTTNRNDNSLIKKTNKQISSIYVCGC